LPLIIIFGLITSYEDIYEGKIKNRYILLAILISIIIYISMIFVGITNPDININWSFLTQTLINSFIALLLGFIVWLGNFWSAGDAKLFFIYSLIIPITIYSVDRIPIFPSFYIIFNSFIPFLMLAFVITVREKIVDKRYGEIREELSAKNIGENALYTFTVTWFSRYILSLINIENNILSIIVTASLIVYIVRKYIYENIPELVNKIPLRTIVMAATGIIIALFRLYLEFEVVLTPDFWITFVLYYIVISMMKGYVRSETKIFFTKEVHVLHLRPGMILVDIIVRKDYRYYIQKKQDFKSRLKAKFMNELDTETVKKLIKHYKRNECDFNKLRVHKTMPFAPLMFLGVILTLLASGAFTNLI